jgi:hypothetical protein
MDKPRPKFCVGEEVMVRSKQMPEFNTSKTEVVEAAYITARNTHNGEIITGWHYKTANRPESKGYWDESALRKLPPEERASWSDCAWQPSKVGA